jgi:GTP-binding protein
MLSYETTPPVPAPRVALVGRPNVGKSAVFNRLVGRRIALVHNEPHVTRDRLIGRAELPRGLIEVIDTGGLVDPEAVVESLDNKVSEVLYAHMAAQTQVAIEMADLVFLVVDGAAGLMAGDEQIARALRRAGKSVFVLVNKVDTPDHEGRLADFYRLGFDHVFAISAEHARGFGELEDQLPDHLPELAALPEPESTKLRALLLAQDAEEAAEVAAAEAAELVTVTGAPATDGAEGPTVPAVAPTPTSQILWNGESIRVAVVGRPNAGKSSLINCLLGEERHLACEIAGATRDAVDSPLQRDGQNFVFVDTAVMRRKRGIVHRLEQLAVANSMRSIERADVVVVLLDGTLVPTEQDVRLAAMAHDKGKGLLLAANKWESVVNPQWQQGYIEAVRLAMPFADYAPILTLSAKTGAHVGQLCKEIVSIQQERHRRVSTGELNRFFRRVVHSHPPPRSGGARPQLYFVSQPMVAPPTFVFATNKMDSVHFSYKRYLSNCLREAYGFGGTPLWVKFRQR